MFEIIRKCCRRLPDPLRNFFKNTLIFINKNTFRLSLFFYSQQGEDKEIYETYFKTRPKFSGVFVELGAMDGIIYSNTKYFEDTLGWKGILIEPVPENFKKLIKNRPDCIYYNCAVGMRNKALYLGKGATAGMLHTMSDIFKNEWHAGSNKQEQYEVECKPLSAIFSETGCDKVDLLSLDVEGGELEVLQTIDWSKVEIRLILFELDDYDQEKNEACREIMIKQGFKFKKRIGNNDLWKA